MYTGGNESSSETRPRHRNPDQPVGAIKLNKYLTDDHLKVTNGSLITFVVIGITGEPSGFIVINQLR